MALGPGVRLGPYEVIALIGEGGMGQVYRATDSDLKRTVAIKVLPQTVATDAERLARFRREAEVLAALNHPNIAQIYGLEKSDGRAALVMELVEGPTLADRITQGPIPIEDALPIAKQIAEAVESAHEQGIIHRDLKPANIKVRPDGTVKVLDFGIAKTPAVDPASVTSGNASQTPTVTTPAHLCQGHGAQAHIRGGQAITGINAIMGTAAYMSPEQARGRPIDTRTDIWAFGCVLYEMLTSRPPFVGVDVSDVLAAVLAREPDFTALPAATPPSIRRLLRRCLHKDRKERLRDIGDVRIEIRDALAKTDAHETIVPVQPTDRRSGKRVALMSALALLALVASVVSVWRFRPAPQPAEARFEITTPPTTVSDSIAISPDGQAIVFVAADEGQSRLWVRSLETGAVRPLPGTDGARHPFWKPDSRAIGFFANNRLKRIDIDGGAVQTLLYLYRGTGGTWSRDGVILASSLGDPIVRISDQGGEPTEVSGVFQQGSNFSPQFLPDGRRFLYYVRGTSDARGVYVGQLDGALQPRRLFESDTGAVYASSGHLLFASQKMLFAQPFDPVLLELTGDRFRVGDHPASRESLGLSVSDTGSIVYRSAPTPVQRRLVWFDRNGKERGEVGTATRLATPSLSRDGQRVVGYQNNPVDGNVDIWLMDTARGASSRLTTHVADDVSPAWSPDDERIVFTSNRKGTTHDLYLKPATPSANEELLLATAHEKNSSDWSSDGRFVLFESRDRKGSDIWAVPVKEERKPFPVVQSDFDEHRAQFSPDGRWIAYQSDETGRPEIHIQAFPGPGIRRPISTNGGTQVRWPHNGQELFYVGLDGRLMAAPIRLAPNTQTAEIGAPIYLFTPPLGGMIQHGDFRHQYTVSADGKRFLISTVTHGATSPITVILNWKPRP